MRIAWWVGGGGERERARWHGDSRTLAPITHHTFTAAVLQTKDHRYTISSTTSYAVHSLASSLKLLRTVGRQQKDVITQLSPRDGDQPKDSSSGLPAAVTQPSTKAKALVLRLRDLGFSPL